MTRKGSNISLKSYEDIFTTEEKRQETGEQIVMVPVKQIHEFKNHPFKVLDDEDMKKQLIALENMACWFLSLFVQMIMENMR